MTLMSDDFLIFHFYYYVFGSRVSAVVKALAFQFRVVFPDPVLSAFVKFVGSLLREGFLQLL